MYPQDETSRSEKGLAEGGEPWRVRNCVRADTIKLRPLPGRRHNATRIDSCAKHPGLSLAQPQPGVVPGAQPLRKHRDQREKYGIHRNSFRSRFRAQRPKNTRFQAVDTFPHPLDSAVKARRRRQGRRRAQCMASIARLCTLNCTLEFEKHVPNVQHVLHRLVELNSCYCCNF